MKHDFNAKIETQSRGSFMSDTVPNVEYGHADQTNILPANALNAPIGGKSVGGASKSGSGSGSGGQGGHSGGSSGNLSYGEQLNTSQLPPY